MTTRRLTVIATGPSGSPEELEPLRVAGHEWARLILALLEGRAESRSRVPVPAAGRGAGVETVAG